MTGEVPGKSTQRRLHGPPERARQAWDGAAFEVGGPDDGRSAAVRFEGDLGLVAADRHPADGVAVVVRRIPEHEFLLGGERAEAEAAGGAETERRRVSLAGPP